MSYTEFVTYLEGVLTSIDTQLATNAATVKGLSSGIDSLQTQIDTYKGQITDIETASDQLVANTKLVNQLIGVLKALKLIPSS